MQKTFADEQQNWHRRILALSWPVILSNLSIPLVGLVDVAILGQLSNPSYIGAITVGTAVFSAIYWLFGFLRMGTTGLVAQAYGAKKDNEVKLTYARALLIATLLGMILVLIQKPLEHLLFILFDASNDVEEMAKQYFSIRIFSAPAVLITLASVGVLFGLQKMKTTLFLTIFLNLSNLSLDVLLVLVFDYGVQGVAIGTLISEWVSAALSVSLVAYQINRSNPFKFSKEDLFQKKQFSQFFDVSGNLIIRTFFVQIPFFVGTLLATE
ncbi:MAG: MATE family efflux transporter, partial [Candidatus Azotimanducaceae bacterium]